MKTQTGWNVFTCSLADQIDNNREELEIVLGMTQTATRRRPNDLASKFPAETVELAIRLCLADGLKERYYTRLERRFDPESNVFFTALAGVLLHDALDEVQWNYLAEHYLQKAAEQN